MRQSGTNLRMGKCPSCERKTLWTWAESPGVVQCDRVGKCGYSSTTKELYPDLYANVSKTYPATKEEPNKTADAYLAINRGFKLAPINGWYEQGKYWNPNGDKGTATVRFWLDAEKTVFWERFIDDVTITEEDGSKTLRKSKFNAGFQGKWWQPPNQTIHEKDHVYLVEGIFDAMSLVENGLKAVAIMSSGTFPAESIKEHLHKKVNWVIALDNDLAGIKSSKKHAIELKKLGQSVSYALPSQGREKIDWNDLHIAHKINPAYIEDYLYYGAAEFASSTNDKAMVIWKRNKLLHYFVFSFKERTYRFKIDEEDYKKSYAKAFDDSLDTGLAEAEAFSQTKQITEIANFSMEYLYSQQPANGDDGWYFLKITYSNGKKPYQCAVSGDVFAESKKFKKTMQIKAHGALFTGSNADMDYLYKQWFATQQKSVRTLDFVGYDEDTKSYVFPEFAVQSGKILKLNAESFFNLKDTGIKTNVDINQRLTANKPVDFIDDYIKAFGIGGLIGMAWWVGSLISVQIRDKHSSYPYMQVIGEPASGKSAMVNFLWKLIGKTSDTFNPNSSSLSGRFRKMAEVSNMPVVFNEVDNENVNNPHAKKFMWDEYKDPFEGSLGRITGIKSNDNSTRNPPFRGGLMAVQNIKTLASSAMLSRFVYLPFDRSHHSMDGRRSADKLRDLEITDVSGFLLQVCSKSDVLFSEYNKLFLHYQHKLATYKKNGSEIPALNHDRVIKCYAQMMALAECLKLIVPLSDHHIKQTQDKLISGAIEWQASLDEDHPVVFEFWQTFEYLNSKFGEQGNALNHSNSPDLEIAISLQDFNARCIESKQETVSTKDLREHLLGSKSRKYLRTAAVYSRLEKRTLRCMIFKA
jgi:hypothetical protein